MVKAVIENIKTRSSALLRFLPHRLFCNKQIFLQPLNILLTHVDLHCEFIECGLHLGGELFTRPFKKANSGLVYLTANVGKPSFFLPAPWLPSIRTQDEFP